MFSYYYCFFIAVQIAFIGVEAFLKFSELLPNGNQIPHPCNRSLIWLALGHQSPEGGGRNLQFGIDFLKANKTWTVELCRKDSDGDGKTNGEELGDPKCVWNVNATPAVTDVNRLSHPGICEPLDSPRCISSAQGKFLTAFGACSSVPSLNSTGVKDYWCPAIAAPFVRSMTLRSEPIKLRTDVDSFLICKQFIVPNDNAYHIIAWEPVISSNASTIVHALTLFSCDLQDEEAHLLRLNTYENASECPLTPPCSSMVVTWADGSPRRCYSNDVGIPIGKNYYKMVILQIHYKNVASSIKNADDLFVFDSSGMTAYFTPILRPNEKALLAIGQTDIALPPRKKSVTVIGHGFGGECSRKQLAPYNSYRIVSVQFHMKQAGNYGRLTLTKNSTGQRIDLVNETMAFDKPKFVAFDGADEIPLEPGDAFEIECRYDTSSRSNWTFWGGSSSTDEICYAFLDIYPRPQNRMFQMPTDLGDLDFCSYRQAVIGNCSKNSIAGILQNSGGGLMANCYCAEAYPAKACSSNCYSFLSRTGLLTNPCLTGMAFHSITRSWISTISEDIYRLQSQINLCALAGSSAPPPNNTSCITSTNTQSSTSAAPGGLLSPSTWQQQDEKNNNSDSNFADNNDNAAGGNKTTNSAPHNIVFSIGYSYSYYYLLLLFITAVQSTSFAWS